jgi:hypothetical protein
MARTDDVPTSTPIKAGAPVRSTAELFGKSLPDGMR